MPGGVLGIDRKAVMRERVDERRDEYRSLARRPGEKDRICETARFV